MTTHLYAFFTCLACFFTAPAFSQRQANNFNPFNPRFEVFELPGAVLGNSVQGIVQDSAGFLWFASQEGLHRYDGQTFFTYRYDPLNANSLLSDYCEYIFLDSKGVLWLAHFNYGGVTAFDPATEQFTRYRHDPNNPETLSSNTNSIIAEDRQGYIWIGGGGGVDRLDRKTGKFKRFHHDPADPRSLSYNHVWGLYVDKKGTLWVGTGFTWDPADPNKKFGGLNRYDPKTETFTRYLHDPNEPTTLAHNQVRAMLEDSRGNFWVGTGGDGLHLMNREKGTFTRLAYDPRDFVARPADSSKLGSPRLRRLAAQSSDRHVSSIFEDRDGRIWITAVFGGLNVYDPVSGTMRHFEREPGAGNLITNFIWHTFQSADGVIWIATGNAEGTVFKVKKEGKRFAFFTPDSFIGGRVVSEVVKDKAGNVWIGYYNNSDFPLIRFDRKSGKSFHFPGTSQGGLNARQANTLLADPVGYIWVGTENGLFRLEPQTGKFRHFPNPLIEQDDVGNLFQDRNGIIWVYDWQEGLRRLDPKTGKYTRYLPDPADPGSIGGTSVSGLFEDARGNLWVGGGSGTDIYYPFFIDRFNPKGSGQAPNDEQAIFTHFIKEPEPNTADDMLQDDQGNIWFLTNGSIEKFDPSTGARQKFTSANSNLLNRNLSGMAKAKNGRIWINSNSGSVFELDPKTGQFQAFGKQYVVPSPTVEASDVHVADDGEVLIGRAGGFIALTQNQEKINLHGKRAAAIVSGMLQHARTSTGKKEPTDLNALADEYLRLSYHGLRAKDPNFTAKTITEFNPAVGKVDVIPQDIGRVLLNLIGNAFYAVSEKAKQGLDGYEPAVTVSTQMIDNQVIIKIKDNGTGIPDHVKDRVFQPFFTTKPTGQGTGLGLSLAYDIVTKGHGGALEVETKEGEGTEFTIILPAKTNGQ